MKTTLLRGLPLAMQTDGWWLNDAPRPPPEPDTQTRGRPQAVRLWVLLALIAAADVLVWQVVAGVSLAVFAALLVGAAIWFAVPSLSPHRLATTAAAVMLAVLPLVELVQPLSVMIAALGVSGALALTTGLRRAALARAMGRMWPLGCVQFFVHLMTSAPGGEATQGKVTRATLHRAFLHWALPLGLGPVFVLLLLDANPIALDWVTQAFRMDINGPTVERIAFWLTLLPFLWTALSLHRMREQLRAAPAPARAGPAREGLINAGSVIRALVLFNAVFAVQTVTDLVVLYGGAALPEGMSYATYAHRGAYPLLATALLAGGFALLSTRWTRGAPLLRALLMVWLVQNVALVVSSLVRLDLYVEVYGLTRLRMAAGIWMGLVAVGLALILWQVWRGHRNGWMLTRIGVLGAATLYACCFISFDGRIAAHNLARHADKSRVYVCALGAGALPAITAHEQRTRYRYCQHTRPQVTAPQDWREWGFRNARLRRTLATITPQAAP